MLDFQNFLGLNKILNVINCYLNIIVQEKFFCPIIRMQTIKKYSKNIHHLSKKIL